MSGTVLLELVNELARLTAIAEKDFDGLFVFDDAGRFIGTKQDILACEDTT
jgi:hypothetical protein